MAKGEKILKRIMGKDLPRDISVDEAEAALLELGYTLEPGGGKGSHRKYHSPTGELFTLPNKSGYVLACYIKEIRNIAIKMQSQEQQRA